MRNLKYEQIPNFTKVSEMMEEAQFWQIIDQSLVKSTNKAEQKAYIEKELYKLSLEEIIGFQLRTALLKYDTYTSEMWCAAYLIRNGCSDDGFEYFRNWLIFRGQEAYCNAKENPDSLLEVVRKIDVSYSYSMQYFWCVALHVFEKRTGYFLGENVDWDTFQTTEGNYPRIELDWDDDESMKAICPRIWAASYEVRDLLKYDSY